MGKKQSEDFIPSCKGCKNILVPALEEGLPPCPACKGKKGKGKCVQFCCRDTCLDYRCGEAEQPKPVYCGTHPFFGGYARPYQVNRDAGQPLLEMKVDAVEEFKLVLAASQFYNPGSSTAWCDEAHIFTDIGDENEARPSQRVLPTCFALTVETHTQREREQLLEFHCDCLQVSPVLVARHSVWSSLKTSHPSSSRSSLKSVACRHFHHHQWQCWQQHGQNSLYSFMMKKHIASSWL